jgi:hypothetical protein
MAAVTSTQSGPSAGTIMLTFVVIVWAPNWKVLTGRALGRSRAISSRVPNARAWLGQTEAHMGLSPTEVRS